MRWRWMCTRHDPLVRSAGWRLFGPEGLVGGRSPGRPPVFFPARRTKSRIVSFEPRPELALANSADTEQTASHCEPRAWCGTIRTASSRTGSEMLRRFGIARASDRRLGWFCDFDGLVEIQVSSTLTTEGSVDRNVPATIKELRPHPTSLSRESRGIRTCRASESLRLGHRCRRSCDFQG